MQYFVEAATILKNGSHVEFFGWLTCFFYSTMFGQHNYVPSLMLASQTGRFSHIQTKPAKKVLTFYLCQLLIFFSIEISAKIDVIFVSFAHNSHDLSNLELSRTPHICYRHMKQKYMSKTFFVVIIINKRLMGHITHLRKQFKFINTYDYTYHNFD